MSLRLVVGLGNDEKKYDLTPHNIGFQALDALAARHRLEWKEEKGQVRGAKWGDVRLAKPLTFMNVSGPAVQWAAGWWRVTPLETLLVCDDFALPWGRLRFRRQGSDGGHNGLDSVITALGTQEIPRLRVGVGPVPEGMDPKDYVLKRMSADAVHELARRASEAVEAALTEGLDVAMNRFNGAIG